MSTEHVKERLSEYIDGLLPDEEKRRIEEHLASCSECAGALGELKKTVSLLRDLDEVEPPAWFTQKVMTRVKEEAGSREGFLRRILGPIHSFIPLEALGAVAIAITVIVVFRSFIPVMKEQYSDLSSKAPATEPAERFDQMEKESNITEQVVPDKKAIEKAPSLPPAPKSGKRKGISPRAIGRPKPDIMKNDTEKGKGFVSPPIESDEIGLMEDTASGGGRVEEEPLSKPEAERKASAALQSAPAEVPSVAPVTEEAAEPTVPVERAEKKKEIKKDKEYTPEPAVPAQPMRRAFTMDKEMEGSSLRSTPPSLYRKILSEQEKRLIRIHLSVLSVDTVVKEIREIAALAGGKFIKTEPDKKKTLVSLSIPKEKIHFLLEKLDMMGEITKTKMPSVEIKGNVDVKIEIRMKITE